MGSILAAVLPLPGAAAGRLQLTRWSVDLPGAPAAVLSADMDGDGRRDLVVVSAVTAWGEVGVSEFSEIDQVKGLVETLTVVPAIVDRREVAVWLARPDGGYAQGAEPLPLALSVLSLEAVPAAVATQPGVPGVPGVPIIALTDDGVSALLLKNDHLELAPLIADPPVLAGTGTFLPNLGLVRRLTGSPFPDLLLPARDGLAVYRGTATGFARRAAARIPIPGDRLGTAWGTAAGDASGAVQGPSRRYPLPRVQDLDGDGLPDLLFRDPIEGWSRVRILRNARQGRFRPPVELAVRRSGADSPEAVFWGDLDGDGLAELVTRQSLDPHQGSIRQEMKSAREPKSRLRLYRLDRNLKAAAKPYQTLDVTGYAFDSDSTDPLVGFRDVNGDGKLDLLTATVDLTVFKAMRSLATRRLNLGVDFHVWCQHAAGTLTAVPRLDLGGTFRFNLNDLKLGQLALISGDFDGDRRPDYFEIGRGKTLAVHRGRADCSFPTQPDLTFDLAEPPRDVALVQVRDLDGDGRADVLVVQPGKAAEPGTTPAVRLDLYLSGGAGPGAQGRPTL